MARQRQLPHEGGRPVGAAATMMLMLLLATATTLFSGTALAQTTDGDNQILYPNSTDLTVHYLDTVVISYETDYTSPWMYLFCAKNNQLQEIAYYSPSDIAGSTSFAFELSFDYMVATSCWFNLRPAKRDSSDNDTDVGASSPTFAYNTDEGDHETFAIDPNSIPTTTSKRPSSTATTATTAIATADPTNATSDSSSNSDSGDSDDDGGGLSTGAKAGIAVGVVALVGLAAATAWLLFDRRRGKKQSPIICELDGGGPDMGGGVGSMSPTGTMKQSVMTTPISPPSAIDHSHNNNHHHYHNNSINNNLVLSPYSAAGGTIDGNLPPPPPPPAAEKLSLTTRQFHELPENPQRFELDGGSSSVERTPASAYTHPSMHSPIIGSSTPDSLHSPTIQHSPKVLLRV